MASSTAPHTSFRFARPPELLYHDWIAQIGAARPDQAAISDPQGAVDFGELADAMRRVSGALLARALPPGSRVVTAMAPSVPHLAVILGAMAAGLVPVPVNTRLTASEASAFLEPLAPSLVIADPAFGELGAALALPVVDLRRADEAASLATRLGPLWGAPTTATNIGEDDPAIIFPTGGTTGVPKGAINTHRSLCLWTWSVAANAGRGNATVELFSSPFFHVSLTTGALSTLFAGGSVDILPRFDAKAALTSIANGANFLQGAPTMYDLLRAHPAFADTDRSAVRSITFGSAAPAPGFAERIRADYPAAAVRTGYGATEFGPVIGVPAHVLAQGRHDGVGWAYPGVHVRVVDQERREVAPGEVGELAVTSPWQTVGYWGRDAETAETWTADGILLGDLGTVEPDGWFRISGRRKEMIISGGENVFPAEVEAVLARHPDVVEVIAYGMADEHWGERVEAAIVARDGMDLQLSALREFGENELAAYKFPKVVRIVDAIPLTANNKPDRRALQAAAAQAQASSESGTT